MWENDNQKINYLKKIKSDGCRKRKINASRFQARLNHKKNIFLEKTFLFYVSKSTHSLWNVLAKILSILLPALSMTDPSEVQREREEIDR